MKKRLLLLCLLTLVVFLSAEKWNFIVYGDNRPSIKEQPYVHYKIVEKMKKNDPALIISTGDIILGRSESLEELRKMYSEFEEVIEPIRDIPFYVAPGNHEDIYTKNAEDYFIEKYNKPYMSILKENALLLLLDSEEIGKKHKIVGEQFEWLKAELEKNQDVHHKFAFVHQPLYPQKSHIGNSLDKYPEDRDKLVNLLKKHNVDMVFVGHVHIFNQIRKNNLNQIITGGGGAPLYAEPDEGGFYHFVNVIVDGDKVEYQVIRVENEIDKGYSALEEGKIEKAKLFAKDALEYLPNHVEPNMLSLIIAKETENKEDYKKFFEKLNEVFGSEFTTYKRIGFNYYYSGRYDIAEKYLMDAMKIEEHKEVIYRLAKTYEKKEEYQKALDFYEKAHEKIESKRWLEYIENKIKKMKKKLQ